MVRSRCCSGDEFEGYGLARLLELVEKGLMEATDTSLRERMVSLRFRRDELAAEVASLSQRLAAAEPVITPAKVERLAVLLRDRLQNDSSDLRQSYARLVLKEVLVTGDEIRISGSKAILARSAADRPGDTSPAVLSFVRQWCTRQGCDNPAISVGSVG
jgi:site-specific DNA recombinase